MYVDAIIERDKNRILVVERDKNGKRLFNNFSTSTELDRFLFSMTVFTNSLLSLM